MVKELQRAVSRHQDIQIIYMGSAGQTTQRTIRPLGISGGKLKAYCLTRRAPRVFLIDNILAVQLVINQQVV